MIGVALKQCRADRMKLEYLAISYRIQTLIKTFLDIYSLNLFNVTSLICFSISWQAKNFI